MTITLGSSCDSPGMSAMPGAFSLQQEFSRQGAKITQRRKVSKKNPSHLGRLCALA
jgi:hypothetical protein